MLKEHSSLSYHFEIYNEVSSPKKLVCLHGFAQECSVWKDISIDNHALYCFDFVGHGKSPRPQKPACYSFDYVLDCLHEQVLRQVQAPYSLLGYSMGGRFALAYALRYENEIEKLILESSGFGLGTEQEKEERKAKDKALAEQISQKGIHWFDEFWSNLPLFSGQKKLPEHVQKNIREKRLQNDAHALALSLLQSGQGVQPYLGEEIKKLSLPILYLSGDNDPYYRSLGQKYAQILPNFYWENIKGAGHNTHLEQKVVFLQKVNNFINI